MGDRGEKYGKMMACWNIPLRKEPGRHVTAHVGTGNYIMLTSGFTGFSPRIYPISPAPQLFLSAINMDLDSDYPPSDTSSSSSEDNKKKAPTMDSRPTAKELLGTC